MVTSWKLLSTIVNCINFLFHRWFFSDWSNFLLKFCEIFQNNLYRNLNLIDKLPLQTYFPSSYFVQEMLLCMNCDWTPLSDLPKICLCTFYAHSYFLLGFCGNGLVRRISNRLSTVNCNTESKLKVMEKNEVIITAENMGLLKSNKYAMFLANGLPKFQQETKRETKKIQRDKK